MSRPVKVELPTGDIVWAQVENSGPADVAVGGLLKLDAEQLRTTVRGVSESLRSALEDVVPDQVQIEFGIELAVKTGKLTSVLAEAGGKAAVKVTLTWTNENAAAATQWADDED
jgi:NTP-dependent ternary system trypsin peptidase co-occuring protein